jgi:hypothetical protein
LPCLRPLPAPPAPPAPPADPPPQQSARRMATSPASTRCSRRRTS